MSDPGKFNRPAETTPKGYTKKASRWRFPHNSRPEGVMGALRLVRMEPRGFAQGARVGGSFTNTEAQRRMIAKEKAEAMDKARETGNGRRKSE